MTPENDYIKPVENLSNVGSLTPIDKHPQKRQRQDRRRNQAAPQDIPEDMQDEQATQQQIGRSDSGLIDYRA